MARPSTARSLRVWMNGEEVGLWTMRRGRPQEFRYVDSWLQASSLRPLSLSLPIQAPDVPHRGDRVEAFFDNLLPDSSDIRRRLQSRFGTRSTSAFDLLVEIGRDCVGAIQLLDPDREPDDVRRIEGEPLDEAGISRALRVASTAPMPGVREEGFRISLAGAQEKTALLLHGGRWLHPLGPTPTTHIFKLPLGRVGNDQVDLSTSVENEWLCSRLLNAFGMAVAPTEIATFGDQRVLVVERFDRRLAVDGSWWMRLPQEDMCQATGTAPGDKYESEGGPGIAEILALLLGARDARGDRRIFLRSQILFWMLAAPDGHAKNFSIFLEPDGAYALTPLYDVISAHPVLGHGHGRISPRALRMAMAVAGKSRHYRRERIRRRHLVQTATRCGMGGEIDAILDDLVERTEGAIARMSKELPPGFPAAVAESIFEGTTAAARELAVDRVDG